MSSAGTLRDQVVGLLSLVARSVWSSDEKLAMTFRKQGGTGLDYRAFVWSCSWQVNLCPILAALASYSLACEQLYGIRSGQLTLPSGTTMELR